MSAAAPTPPPHRYIPNGHASSRSSQLSDASSSSSASGFRGQTTDGSASARQPRPIPHLKDLVLNAEDQIESRKPIGTLLENADTHLKQANFSRDIKRYDQAYVEYLVACSIVLTVIPRHKDLPSLSNLPRLYELNRTLIKRLQVEQDGYDRIKNMIKDDNHRNGTRPASNADGFYDEAPEAPQSSIVRPSSPQFSAASYQNSSIPPSLRSGPLRLQNHQRNSMPPASHGTHSTEVCTSQDSDQHKTQSEIFPNGKSHSVSPSPRDEGPKDDPLPKRFAQLRFSSQSARGDSRQYSASSSSHDTTATSWYNPRDSSDHQESPVTNGSPPRPRVHVNTSVSKDLPKPPSPTYTPTKATVQPLRSARANARNHVSYDRPASVVSTNSNTSHRTSKVYDQRHSDQRSDASDDTGRPVRRRRKSVNQPREIEISAERLYDYLRVFDVLLIDVRNRTEYDSGHIFSRSSMCIEPTALRKNMSAEELQEALVLSPDHEQSLFQQRDRFDLVVYYDQSTPKATWTTGRSATFNPEMKYLQETLYDFNQEQPLQFPPILLEGGLDAWISLMGNQALQASDTRRIGQPKTISRRPLPPAHSSGLEIHRRRHHRDYNPLDPEEERKWRERARSESIVLDSQPPPDVSGQTDLVEEPETPNTQALNEFNKRFPDVNAVEGRSATPSSPSRFQASPRIPEYPKAPAPSQPALPGVPSRPAPAVPRPSYSGVSERVIAQSQPTTKPSQLPPYIPQMLKRLPRTGLHNFGGITCYMNATIQCLSASIPLTAFFLDNQFTRYLQRDNWKGSKGLMPELYNTLLRNLWQTNDVDTIRPTNFRKFCARLNKEWGLERQQDAKEFLEFLVDCLHEDLNVNWRRNPLRSLTPEEEAERERTPPLVASKREWDRYEHRDHSRLTDLFAGQHISRLQCTTCHHSSTVYEPFYSISVEIPANTSNRPVDIRDCLRSYCSAETLAGDEVWRCPRCCCEREATKRITITRAPEFLVVHFKRFSAGHSERARKIHTPVEFPLVGLDLEPFMLPPPDSPLKEFITGRYGQRELETPHCMTPPYRYDAYAVMRHLGGTMTSGHYIALVQDKARGCWREFNDDRVTDFQPQSLSPSRRLQNEQAYIVFYQRSRVLE